MCKYSVRTTSFPQDDMAPKPETQTTDTPDTKEALFLPNDPAIVARRYREVMQVEHPSDHALTIFRNEFNDHVRLVGFAPTSRDQVVAGNTMLGGDDFDRAVTLI